MRILYRLRRVPAALRSIAGQFHSVFTLVERLFAFRERYHSRDVSRRARLALAALEPRLVPTADILVNTYTGDRQAFAAVASDADGDFVVVWQSRNQDAYDGWYGIYAQRYSANGTPQGSEFRVNSYTTNSQESPSVAMDADGDFVVAWTSYGQDGYGYPYSWGVYAQRYSANGTPQGSEFRVNSYTTGDQGYYYGPSVAMDADGDFVIAWGGDGASGGGIYAQRYAADGTSQGSEFKAFDGGFPSVAMDADGNFVVTGVVLVDPDIETFDVDVHARLYSADGTARGSAFRVNTYTADVQGYLYDSFVAMDADGDFVVAWESYGIGIDAPYQDGSGPGVFAQRYSADGTPQGSEFQVNSYTTGNQSLTTVAMDADGNFAIAWTSGYDQDGGWSIYAQRYEADGTPDGSEFRVNTSGGNQVYPSAAMDADGDLIIAWDGTGPGDEQGIFVRLVGAGGSSSVVLETGGGGAGASSDLVLVAPGAAFSTPERRVDSPAGAEAPTGRVGSAPAQRPPALAPVDDRVGKSGAAVGDGDDTASTDNGTVPVVSESNAGQEPLPSSPTEPAAPNEPPAIGRSGDTAENRPEWWRPDDLGPVI